MDLVNTLAVGGKQGTDQQHCCAGCPNEGCQDAANCQEDCVVSWGCSNIAGEVNTTRDHVEREQQADELEVFNPRINQWAASGLPEHPQRRRNCQDQCDGELRGIALPPV